MRTLLISSGLLAAIPAYAHPGEHHQGLLATLWHLASEPDHLALMTIAVVIGAGAAIASRRRAQQKRNDRDSR